MRRVLITTTVCLMGVVGCFGQDPDRRDRNDYRRVENVELIPAGTRIQVRADRPIDVRDYSDGRIYTGTVSEDVYGPSDRLLIPRGAHAELIVQNVGNHQMALDLDSLSVDGRRYMVRAEAYRDSRRTGIGANKRTGEYVGGGALFGTIIGAIAGGGKGAAIGALAGAAAGGGAEVLTKGGAVYIPAETIVTFNLDQPLGIATGQFSEDNGYDDHGNHYHTGYYDRNRGGRQ